jgi:phage anti-repressor protein
MSADLLKIESVNTAAGVMQLVSAKALHKKIGNRRDFSTWFKARAEGFGFTEGVNYFLDSTPLWNQDAQNLKQGGDRKSKDYNLTMDMAKELAMLEKNEAGPTSRTNLISIGCNAMKIEHISAKLEASESALSGSEFSKVTHQNLRLAASA